MTDKMSFQQRITFITGFFNSILIATNITPIVITPNEDGTVNFGSLDGKYYSAKNQLRNVCIALLDNIFSYITLKDFDEIAKSFFFKHEVPSFYALINTKPFGQQKYFEKRYYIAELKTNEDMQIEVTQVGKKKINIIGFIVAGEHKQEFTSAEEALPFFKNLYVQVLCDVL